MTKTASHASRRPTCLKIGIYLIPALFCLLLSAHTAAAYLTHVETHKDGNGGVDGLSDAWDIAVSPDNKHVYVAGDDEGVAVFSRNTSTGSLTYVEAVLESGGFNSVFVSPDGNHLYATNGATHAVFIFKRDLTSGKISDSYIGRKEKGGTDSGGTIAGLHKPSSVTVSPDNAHVYATSIVDNYLVVFSRDSGTGELTLVEEKTGITGLDAPQKVVVSPDGKHVYVASEGDAVVVFSRNAVTGQLTHEQTIENSAAVDNTLDGCWDIVVSPDNNYVYTAAFTSNAVAVFSRNTTTGELSYEGKVADTDTQGSYTVDGLAGARSVTVSPDGKIVVAAGSTDKAVAVFLRDAGTGLLTWREVKKENTTDAGGNINGLEKASSVTFSPDGGNVYAAAYHADHAVTVFDAGPVTQPPGESGYYRLAFLSSTLRNAASSTIDDYNTFVRNLAEAHPELDALNTTWTAIVSTTAKDARVNTATTGIGVPIYRMDGYKIADNYGDLWDGEIAKTLDIHENGIQYLFGDPDGHAYTGTNIHGTKASEAEVGSSDPNIGSSWDADNGWIGSTTNGNNTDSLRIYAISGVLPAPAAPPAPTMDSAAVAGGQVEVSFTPPTGDNGTAITSYTATSSPGGITGSGTASPITVAGLTYGTTYTFTVTATSSAGTSNNSGISNSVYYGLWYQDGDGDGYGNPAVSTGPANTQPAGYVKDGSDCDDIDADIHPGASEIVDNSVDENCDGVQGQSPSQPALPVYTMYADADGDGFGDPASALNATSLIPGYVLNSSDCNDNNAAICPGAPETAGDGIDQDCDGKDDLIWCADFDLDGYGNAAKTIQSATQPTGYVADSTDCNNGNPDIYPGAPEIPNDGLDQDCSGKDLKTWYLGGPGRVRRSRRHPGCGR